MMKYAAFAAAACILLTVAVAIIAGRRARARSGEYNSDSLGFIGAVVSGLFIVVAAFYTVIGWEEASAADDSANREAYNLSAVYWNVSVVPQAERDAIRALIRDYTTQVVEQEWPLMAEEQEDTRSYELMVQLRAAVSKLPSTPDDLRTARDRSLERLREAADSRQDRIGQATGPSESAFVMLIGTIVGSVGMVAFPLLVGLSASLRHVLLMIMLSLSLVLTCLISIEIDHPYSGWIKVGPDAFETLAGQFESIP